MGAETLGRVGRGGGSQKLSRVMRGDQFGVITFQRGMGHVSPCFAQNPPTPLPPFLR